MKNGDYWQQMKVLNAEELRNILRISPNKFRSLLEAGKLPKPLPLGGKCRRWSACVVAEYLNMSAEEQYKWGA